MPLSAPTISPCGAVADLAAGGCVTHQTTPFSKLNCPAYAWAFPPLGTYLAALGGGVPPAAGPVAATDQLPLPAPPAWPSLDQQVARRGQLLSPRALLSLTTGGEGCLAAPLPCQLALTGCPPASAALPAPLAAWKALHACFPRR